MPAVRFEPLKPFGALVDYDLNQPFERATIDALQKAYRRHHMLVFRGQDISRERQADLTALFGTLPPEGFGLSFVSNKGGAATLGDAEIAFHFDMDFAPDPYRVISLYAVRLEDGQTSTRFVDAINLWRHMPAELKARIEGREVRNVFAGEYAGRPGPASMDDRRPQHVYALPRPHPETGEPILSLSVGGTREVVGMPREESEALLMDLFAYCERSEHVLEHVWYRGDLIVWDNMALLHARGATGAAERTLQKVSAVPRTLAEQFPQFPGGWSDLARLFPVAEPAASA